VITQIILYKNYNLSHFLLSFQFSVSFSSFSFLPLFHDFLSFMSHIPRFQTCTNFVYMFMFNGKDEKPRRRKEERRRIRWGGEAANTRIFIYANGIRSWLIVRPHIHSDSRDGYPGIHLTCQSRDKDTRGGTPIHPRNFRLGTHLRHRCT